MNMTHKLYHPVFVGVSLVAMAILSLEVILTRIFSFSIWYHFVYLTISMALLGFGSSGTILAAYPRILEKGRYQLLVIVSLLSCIFIVAALLIFSRYPLQPDTMFWKPIRFSFSLMVYYVGITLPFFCAGMAIAIPLAMFSERVSYLYFWDLAGASIGSLLSLLLLNWLGAPGGVLVCALIMLVAASLFAWQISKRLTVALAVLVLVLLAILPLVKDRIEVISCKNKLYQQTNIKPLFSQWNAINRVDVWANLDQGSDACFWCNYGISDAYQGTFPDVHTVVYDGHNGSNIFQFNGDPNEFRFLDSHMLKIPYLLLDKPSVLVVGVGGGVDVFNAFHNKAASITAVELQPITVDLLKGEWADWTGNIFNTYEHINLIANEARNFINRDHQKYDHIQLTTTDTFIALNTGAYVLMESYLYTVDAIARYFDHLTDNGLLCIIVGDLVKDGYKYQPLNSRLVLQYLEVLRSHGIQSPQRHIAVLGKLYRGGRVLTFPLLKKTPFTAENIVTLDSFAKKVGAYFVFNPLDERIPDSFIGKIITLPQEERKRVMGQTPYNSTPCTDNKPFFFHFIKWENILDVFDPSTFIYFTPVFGQAIILLLLIQSVILSFFFIMLPLLTSKKTSSKLGASWRYLFYFLAIGIGFMFIEISFIQKFVLFLGYPAYAFAITIFSLLLFSGLGSYWTGRFHGKEERSITTTFFILVPILLLYTWLLPRLFDYFIGESFTIKVLVTMLTQMPLGFVLWMFFPLGIKVVRRVDVRMVPWAWGVNGMSSVVSTILAIILAMSYGFTLVSYLAIIVYCMGTGSLLLAVQRSGNQ